MKRLSKLVQISLGFMLMLALIGCQEALKSSLKSITEGNSLKNMPAIFPDEENLPEGHSILDMEVAREQFDPDAAPRNNGVIVTKDGIEFSIVYWRSADLDFKYNRGNNASVFYEREAAHQGDKCDVFYVKLVNNREQKVIFDVKKCRIVDQGENMYGGHNYEDLKERLMMMSRIGGIMVKNGLQVAKEILLEKQVAKVEDGIPPGGSVEGFLAFQQVKLNATDLSVQIPVEKAPPEGTAARYQTVPFEFKFKHDRGIRLAQPPPKRY
ncbi:hypothetical protein CMK19_15685 [Candidatus Poribacteria bacterium]|nr:hypothetical protein [Candidatus Poribacteria bacterium]MEE2910408.1 hypothetical protein [Candidatus Poribacteria bacterium]|tara:strand:- start:724 stop:1527 length:804 start_codon:yes stop_codon:yes gene_type:complete